MIDILFAIDPLTLTAFLAAIFVLIVTPGADFLLVTTSAIQSGGKIGRAAAFGVMLGIIVHVAAAAAGVSALLIAYPAAFDAIRYLGAAYLLFIAYRAWTAPTDIGEARAAQSAWRAFRRGFVTNVLNPKTALFIFAFIPQFADPSIGPVWQQIVIFGAIFWFFGLLFIITLASAAGRLAPVLRRHIRAINRATGFIFSGLAVRLALE